MYHPTTPAQCRKGGIATMSKLAIASLAGLLALSAPALAQAKGHHGHHHQRSHHHARIMDFRPAPGNAAGTKAADIPAGTPEEETAGSITSFENGVLILTLNDKTTVKGKVTEQTDINCEPAPGAAHAADNGDDGNEEGSSGTPPVSSGEDGNHDEQNNGQENGDDNGQGDDDQGENGQVSSCGPASLQPGTLVREAKLRIGPGGSVFVEIDLVG
jgi:hypothetical protein